MLVALAWSRADAIRQKLAKLGSCRFESGFASSARFFVFVAVHAI